jgi:alanine dehydrogenase
MLILNKAEVEALLDLDALVKALAAAMADLSAGRASVPPRIAAVVPERQAMLAVMPAHLPSANALTAKLVSLFPENRDRPTHQALICAFDPATGTPLAVMDGTYITEARTAAGSALATQLLARSDASRVTIIGTGAQAHAHARAVARLPGVQSIRICGRRHVSVDALVAALREELHGRVEVEAADSMEDGVRWADVVCAATHGDTPVVRREWLRPGTHINSVGFNSTGDGEVDAATIRDSLLVVESRAAGLAPPPTGAIELLRAIDAGIIGPEHVHAEIGELVAGTATGRTDDSQITLYKSVGVAVQDAAAAALVLAAASARGVGTNIEL